MTIARVLCLVFAISIASATASQALLLGPLQSATSATESVSSRISVTLPQNDAELLVEGQKVQGSGTFRNIESRLLPKGKSGEDDHHRAMEAEWLHGDDPDQTGPFHCRRAGDRGPLHRGRRRSSESHLRGDAAGCRGGDGEAGWCRSQRRCLRAGCGDARITIAGIRRGAQRGICIDIDEERAKESAANVRAAGLSDRIDVRHGDALDLKDLSQVTVVLLYMGDHFNMLIRPVLWRDLKVGSRIVSHAFTMGDWKPNETITFHSDGGGDYQLHLWTITEDVKKRLAP